MKFLENNFIFKWKDEKLGTRISGENGQMPISKKQSNILPYFPN